MIIFEIGLLIGIIFGGCMLFGFFIHADVCIAWFNKRRRQRKQPGRRLHKDEIEFICLQEMSAGQAAPLTVTEHEMCQDLFKEINDTWQNRGKGQAV